MAIASGLPANGIVGGYTGDDVNIQRAIIAFSAIAWYNTAELIFLICIRFKRRQGLYFWSLMITCWAIVVYQIGSFGKMSSLVPDNPIPMTVLTNVGWLFMIGGNSLVLYSRLHMLTQSRMLLRCVLWGVIINTIAMYIPTTILDTGANVTHIGEQYYVDGYSVMERVQMSVFTIQESIISAIYLLEAWRFLKVLKMGKSVRGIMYELVAVNVMLILLDLALLTVAQKNLFAVEVTFKGFVYSVKLKLELGVLSRLVKVVKKQAGGTRSAVLESDPAAAPGGDQAFTGLDFSAIPYEEKEDKLNTTSDSSNSNSSDTAFEKPALERRTSHAIPWLSTTSRSKTELGQPTTRPLGRLRALSLQPGHHPFQGRFQRRHARSDSSTISPTTTGPQPPPQVQPASHICDDLPEEDGGLWADLNYVSDVPVTESAVDDTIRQFQFEIDKELGGQPSRDVQLSHLYPEDDRVLTPEECKTETARAFEKAEERRKSMRDSEQGYGFHHHHNSGSGGVWARHGSGDSGSPISDADWQRKLGVLAHMQSSGLIGVDVGLGLGSPASSSKQKSPVVPRSPPGGSRHRSFEDGSTARRERSNDKS